MLLAKGGLSLLFVCSVCLGCGGSGDHNDPTFSSGGMSGDGGAFATGGVGEAGRSNGGNATSGASSTSGAGSMGGVSSMGGAGTSAGRGAGGSTSGGSGMGGSGGSGAGGEVYSGPGTVTDLWNGFCVVTFSADYMVNDAFQTPLFTAHAGEKYLVINYNEVTARLAYLTPAGPISFDVPASAQLIFPFTSSCAPNPPHSYFAVFANVSVFAEPELVTKICDLKDGAAVMRDVGKGAGSALQTSGAQTSVYEISLNAFGPQCGGADKGYVQVHEITVFGTPHTFAPFTVIAAEK